MNPTETISSPQVECLDDDISKLEATWNLVLPTYFDKCVELSKEKGSGVSIFKMLTEAKMNESKTNGADESPQEPNIFNCELHYFSATDRSFNWDLVLETVPNRTEMLAMYDPENHIMISVHVPVGDTDDTIGTIRLFQNVLVDEKIVEVTF